MLMALALPAAVPGKTYRKPMPRLYGDSVPINSIWTSRSKIQQNIVDVHNYYRSRVNPPAANMLMMKWHHGLARQAQRWANSCPGLVHDNASQRYINNLGNAGQNIFMTTGRTKWNFAIRMWYDEHKLYKYGNDKLKNFHGIGHYTQVVWATTHLVGCGVNHCTNSKGPLGRDYTIYVCNYAPGGNYQDRMGHPYVAGTSCSMCPNHCSGNRLCTNSCDYANVWSNCDDLYRTFPDWVCNTNTKEGLERRKFCGATCNCKGKIYY